MRFLTTAIVCIAVLIGVDAYFFSGTYFGALRGLTGRIAVHFR